MGNSYEGASLGISAWRLSEPSAYRRLSEPCAGFLLDPRTGLFWHQTPGAPASDSQERPCRPSTAAAMCVCTCMYAYVYVRRPHCSSSSALLRFSARRRALRDSLL